MIFDRVNLAESEWSGRIIIAEYDWLAEYDLGRIRMSFPWITLAESDCDG